MSFEKNVPQIISFVYDATVDATAAGVKNMRPEAVNRLRPGLVVTKVYATVLVAFNGATAATVGITSDTDGFVANVVGAALGAPVQGGGALISDGTYTVPGTPINGDKLLDMPVIETTGVATAGKVKVDFHCYMPAV